MPELPEVETIKNAIKKALKSALIEDVVVNNDKLRMPITRDFSEKIKGCKITDYKRIAKYIIINLDNDMSIILHLGMSGKIKLSNTRGVEEKHDHIIFKTSEGYMIYNDPRRFGLCLLIETKNLLSNRIFKKVGIDPFEKSLDGMYLFNKIQNKSSSIKQTLLDQSIVCGIGNIYASEALFLAGIHPSRRACDLSLKECSSLIEKIRLTLKQAIKAGGSTLRDYKKPDGSLGYFQNLHCVYNKTGHPCPDCSCNLKKTGGIQKIVQGGRSTFFCPTKQR